MKKLDIIRTSASRLECLQKSTESLLNNLQFSGELRTILHEDVLNKEESDKLIDWAKKQDCFDVITLSDPPITQGPSLDFLLKESYTEYVFNYEDDWELLRPINIDLMLRIMDTYKQVNQIAFHKRKIMANRYEFIKKEVTYDGITFTTNPHWAFTPAIWRRSFIDKFWICPEKGANPVWVINPRVKRQKDEKPFRDADWMIRNVGAYFLGGIREPAYVKHLGFEKSVRVGELQWS